MKNSFLEKGFTMVELTVVSLIGAVIFAVLMRTVSSTGHGVKRGSDLIQTQRVLENLTMQIRTDIRSLRYLDNVTAQGISFRSVQKGKEYAISYDYTDGVLTRRNVTENKAKPMNVRGEVPDLEFAARPSKENFQYLEMAFQVKADEQGIDRTVKASRVSIICRFFPFCRENQPLFVTP